MNPNVMKMLAEQKPDAGQGGLTCSHIQTHSPARAFINATTSHNVRRVFPFSLYVYIIINSEAALSNTSSFWFFLRNTLYPVLASDEFIQVPLSVLCFCNNTSTRMVLGHMTPNQYHINYL